MPPSTTVSSFFIDLLLKLKCIICMCVQCSFITVIVNFSCNQIFL